MPIMCCYFIIDFFNNMDEYGIGIVSLS